MARGRATGGANLSAGGRPLRASSARVSRPGVRAPSRPRATRGTGSTQMPGRTGASVPASGTSVRKAPAVRVTTKARRAVPSPSVPRVGMPGVTGR